MLIHDKKLQPSKAKLQFFDPTTRPIGKKLYTRSFSDAGDGLPQL
jgi:hypothetical protein